MNVFQIMRSLQQAAAFYFLKPKVSAAGHLLLISGLLAIRQITPIYGDILEGMVLFVLFTVVAYSGEKQMQKTFLYPLIALLNLAFDSWLIETFPDALTVNSFWLNQSFIFIRLALYSFIERLILTKLPPAQSNLYIPLLLVYLVLYYRHLQSHFAYLFYGQSTLNDILSAVLIVFFTLFFFTLVFFQYSYTQRTHLASQKAQLKIDEDYANLLKKQYDEMRQFRHDYQNTLLSFQGWLLEEDYQAIKKFLDHQVGEFKRNDQLELTELIHLNNPPLRHLIYTKLIYADSLGIKFNLEISEETDLKVEKTISLTKALGILLDNAIEAMQENLNGILRIAFIDDEDYWIILITNPFEKNLEAFNVASIYQKDVSIKGEGRGLGLTNLMKIVDQEKWLLSTEIEDATFIQELTLPKELN